MFDLVLLDDKNPRSVLFQINQLAKHFDKLPKEREEAAGSGKSILQKCVSQLTKADARELAESGEWAKSNVAAVIRETLATLPKLSDAIAASYFAHSSISRTGRGAEQ